MDARDRNGFFNPRRFAQLLLRELATSYKGLLIAMATVGGALILWAAVRSLAMSASGMGFPGGGGNPYLGFFQNLLFLGGFIVTSLAFREVWQSGSGIFYLTLPGSVFEKFLSKLLVTSVGFAVGTAVFMTATAAVSEGLDRLIFGVGLGFFSPFTEEVLLAVARYLVLQSFFLLGSIWFKKLAFVRTVLWMVILGVGVAVISMIAIRVGLGRLNAGIGLHGGGMWSGGWAFDLNGPGLSGLFAPGGRGHAGLMAFKTIGQALFIALAPASWLAAYFRLGEAEA